MLNTINIYIYIENDELSSNLQLYLDRLSH